MHFLIGYTFLSRKTTFNVSSNDSLTRWAKRYGDVRDVYIPVDYYTRQPKRFAYIKFKNEDEALALVRATNDHTVNGVPLFVDMARGRRRTADDMRRREYVLSFISPS